MENEQNTNQGQKKWGGRQAGTPNKVSAKLREQLADILEEGLDQFMVDLELCKPKERVDAYLQIAKFCIPTLKAVEVNDVTPGDSKSKKVLIKFVDKGNE